MNTPLTPEEIVNSFKVGAQVGPEIATLANGDYVIVWSSTGQDGSARSVVAQRFTAEGARIGNEFVVNSTGLNDQTDPAIGATDDGGFVISWVSADLSSNGVFAQRFDAFGVAQGGEFRVNTDIGNAQNDPAVIGLPGGGFAIAWFTQNEGGSFRQNVNMQLFDVAGTPTGTEITINTTGQNSSSSESQPRLAAILPSAAPNGLAAGGIIAVFTASDGSSSGIRAQRYDPTGTPLGTEFVVNTTTTNTQSDASVAGLTGGRFVVVWTGNDSSGNGVFGQVFEGDGTAVGAEFLINLQEGSTQNDPEVTATSDGGFAVTWTSTTFAGAGDGNSNGVISRRFDVDGNALTGETVVNEETSGNQRDAEVSALANGTFVVAWTSATSGDAGDGSGDGIVQRLMGDPLTFALSSENPEIEAVSATRVFDENTVNGAAQLLDADGAAAVSDMDSADFDGGRLLVSSISSTVPSDQFPAQDDAGQHQLGLDTSGAVSINGVTDEVSVNGTIVGTITSDGTNGAALEIALNTNADAAAVEVLIENLTYQNLSDDPQPSSNIAIMLEDGDGGASTPAVVTIQINSEDDRDGKLRGEARVNTFTNDNQSDSDIAGLTDGGYISVWASFNQDNGADGQRGIFAQRYDLNGVPVGTEFLINSTVTSDQRDPAVAGLTDGGWVVVWRDDGATGVRLDRYDAAGVRTQTEIQVETNTSGSQANPDVIGLTNGGYVVTWTAATSGSSGDGSSNAVRAQLFNAAGATVGGEIAVNVQTTSAQDTAKVSQLAGGGFVVVWEENNTGVDGSGVSVAARVFDDQGVGLTGDIQVNTGTNSNQTLPQVATLSNGDFVITWRSEGQDGSSGGIYYQRFTAAGVAVGAEIQVNETTSGDQTVPSIIALDTGGFVIAWTDTSVPSTGQTADVFAQVFSADGSRVDSEVMVNTETASTQSEVVMTALPNGNYVVQWTSNTSGTAGDGSSNGVFQQIIGDPSEIVSSASPVLGGLFTDQTITEDQAEAGIPLIGAGASTLIDPDSADLDGGHLLLSKIFSDLAADDFNAPDDGTQDNLSIQTSGTITITGGTTVNVGGVAVATLTSDGQNGTDLRLDFLPGATLARVETLINAIRYQNTSDDPAATRSYELDLADGDGGLNTATTLNIDITPVAEPTFPQMQGVETQVNSFTINNQDDAEMATLNDGGWVVVWESSNQDSGSSDGIYMQRFDANGAAASGEILVNTTLAGNQRDPVVTALGNGGWVVAWEGAGTGDTAGIFTQRYNADGTPAGTETLVNTTTTSSQIDPAIATTDTGGYVVAWTGQDGSSNGIFFQRYDVNGGTLGTQTQANVQTSSAQDQADIAFLNDGRFVVVWTSNNSGGAGDGSSDGVIARAFNANGTPASGEFIVNSTTNSQQQNASIGATADGGFVIAWSDSSGQDNSGTGIAAQRFDSTLTPQGGEFVVNDVRSSTQEFPDVIGLTNGRFVIAWTDLFNSLDGASNSLRAQVYEANGDRVDGEFRVNTQGAGSQFQATGTALPNGNFVIGWTSTTSGSAGDGNANGVFQKIFGNTPLGVSAAPTVLGLNTAVTLTENDLNIALQRIDADKTIALGDLDSPDFDTGVLTLSVDQVDSLLSQLNGQDGFGQDELGLVTGDVGNGDVQITGSGVGATVTVNGTGIGTISSDGQGGADFSITFNSNATVELVEAVLGNLAYGNSSSNPLSGRRLKLDLSDGDGNAAKSSTVVVTITQDTDVALVASDERRVNAHTDNVQTDPDIVELTGGGFVVIWDSANQDNRGTDGNAGVYGQIYDASGVPTGQEFRINTTVSSEQDEAKIAATSDGGFVVIWEDSVLDGSSNGIFGQRFNADGSLNGAEFQVNLTTSGAQSDPAVAAFVNGGFVVTFTGSNADGSSNGVVSRTFDAAGVGAASTVVVNVANTSGSQDLSDVATLVTGGGANAGHVVVFTGPDGSSDGVFARIFDSTGAALGNEFLVHAAISGNQSAPSVTGLTGGGFVATWTDNGRDGSGEGVYARVFDNLGNAQGADFRVNSTTSFSQNDVNVTALADGGFLVTLTDGSGADGSGSRVVGQRYDASGTRIDGQFQINQEGSSNQAQPAATSFGTGFATVWRSETSNDAGDGSSQGIFLRTFEAAPGASTAPELSSFARTVTLFADDLLVAPGVLDDDVTFSDPDNANFSGGIIDVYYTTPSITGDALTLDQTGTVSITNTDEVRINGTQVGTIDSTLNGAAGAGLRITLNASADVAAVDTLLTSLALDSTAGGGTTRGIGFLVTDGTGGQTEPDAILVSIQAGANTNTGLAITDFGLNENEQRSELPRVAESSLLANPIVLDADVDLDDFAGTSFDTGFVQLSEVQIFSLSKLMSVADNGTGTGQIGFDDTTGIVTYEGTAIGTRDTNLDGADNAQLRINLNANADAESVKALVEALTFGVSGTLNTTLTQFDLQIRNQAGDTVNAPRLRLPILPDVVNATPGEEDQVNTFTFSNQQSARIGTLSDGGYVVVWNSTQQDNPASGNRGIFAQIYNAQGNKEGNEFQVNDVAIGDQVQPRATGLSNGNFVLTWTDNNSRDGSVQGVFAQIYQNDGSVVGAAFQVNEVSSSTQRSSQVVDLGGGRFMATWDSSASGVLGDGSGFGIFGRTFDATGAAEGAEFQINATTPSTQQRSSAAALPDGSVIVVWEELGGADGSGAGVFAQRLDNNGVRLDFDGTPETSLGSGEMQINTTTSGAQDRPDVAALLPSATLPNGGMVFVWESPDGSSDGIFAQIYDINGVAIGSEFQVNVQSAGNQSDPVVMGRANGGFTVAWSDNNNTDGSGTGVIAQSFLADGTQDGDSFIVNVETSSTQNQPELGLLNNGALVATWTSANSGNAGDGNSNGVFQRLFDTPALPAGAMSPVLEGVSTSVRFQENAVNAGLVTLDTDGALSLTDMDSADFDGGRVVLSHIKGSSSLFQQTLAGTAGLTEDELGLVTGNGISVTGSNVLFNATIIGTIDATRNGQSGADLVIDLNTSATPEIVETLVAQLGYANDSNGPAATRELALNVTDGDGGSTGTHRIVVHVDQEVDRTALPQGNEEQVNSFITNSQSDAATSAIYDSSGVQIGYVTVWQSTNQDRIQDAGTGIFGQIFDLNGAPVGGEFLVHTHTEFSQTDPAVTGLESGGFVVSWTDDSFASPVGLASGETSRGVFGRVFDETGAAVGDDFLINDVTASTQRQSDLAARSNGNILAVWTDDGGRDSSGSGVFLREFSPTGVAQGGAIQVNTESSGAQSDATIAVLTGGRVVVTWTSQTSSTAGDGSGNGVFARLFEANGTPVGAEFQVNTITNSSQDAARVAALQDGSFVVVWDDDSGSDGSGSAVLMQHFDVNGTPIGTEQRVNETTVSSQFDPYVIGLDTGGWVVAWSDNNGTDGSGTGVFAQIFAADGTRVDGQFQLNTEFSSTQSEARLVALPGGGFTATWTSVTSAGAGDGSGNGIFQQVFSPNGVALTSDDPILSNMNAQVFSENVLNTTPQLLSPNAGLGDLDSADFNGGMLSVVMLQNRAIQPQFTGQDGAAQDQLGIDQSGNLAIVGTALNLGGTQIGTIQSDGVDGAELRVLFNGNADLDAARTVLRALTYGNSSDDPATARKIAVQLTDGDGGSVRSVLDVTITPDIDGAEAIGSDVQTNSFFVNNQSDSHVAVLADGGYVIVWTSTDQDATGDSDFGIFGQRYDASGAPVGGEFQINTTTISSQFNAQVEGLATGGFVVAWESDNQEDMNLQVFDGNGARVGGEIIFNTPDNNNGDSVALEAFDDPVNGSFILVLDGQKSTSPFNNQIVGQRFNDAGGQIGSTLIVDPAGANGVSNADVAVQSDGTFVVVFTANNLDNPGDFDTGVFLQRFAADASAIGAPIQVNTIERFSQFNPRVAATEDGGYVVVYDSDNKDDFGFTNSPGIYGQRFDGAGNMVGTEFLVNEVVDGTQQRPDVVGTTGGGFAVTYTDQNGTDGSSHGVYLQKYDANGNRLDGALQVNENTPGAQFQSAVAALANGNYVVSFTSDNTAPSGDGNSNGIFHRLVGNPGDFAVGGKPILDGVNASVTYDENLLNGVPQLIVENGAAAVSDPDSADFDGGSILVSNIISSAPLIDQINPPDDLTQDQLGLRQGPRISISGNNVSVDSTVVATIGQDGQDGAPFELLLNSSASAAIVELLVESLTYRNISDDPLPQRPLRIQITDGDGGASDPVLVTVNITPTPDAAVAVGGERIVNTTNSGSEASPEVATLPGTGGDFVVVFESVDGNGDAGIRAQRFDDQGNPVARDGSGLPNGVTDEFVVNVNSDTGTQETPDIAAFSDGSFVVVWRDAAIDPSFGGIAAQLFNSDGTTNGPVVQINSETSGFQTDPHVAVLDNDDFVVSWTSGSSGSAGDGSGDGIIARRFDSSGVAQGTPNSDFVVNTSTTSTQNNSAITNLNDGGFLITWTDHNGTDGSGQGIFAQRYDASGATVGGEFQINSTSVGQQNQSDVKVLDNGNLIVAWRDDRLDQSSNGIFAQIYDVTGAPVNNEFRVNDQRIGSQSDPSIAALDTGGFVVAWTDSNFTDGSFDGVYAQQFDANGNRLDNQFQVNTTTSGSQNQADVASLPGGGFVVTFNGSVMLQVYGNDAPTVSPVSANGDEDTAIVLDESIFDAGFSDPNGNTLAEIRIETFPTNGTLTVAGVPVSSGQIVTRAQLIAGDLVYLGNQDFNGPDSFQWTGSDGISFATSSVLADITVNPVNDAPGLEAGADTTLTEGQALNRLLQLTDPDTDNRSFTVTFGDGGSQNFNSTSLSPTISHTYTSEGIFTVTVNVDDNSGAANAQETDTFTVTVINGAPLANADFGSVNEDGPAISGNVLTNDSDPGGDPITVSAVNSVGASVGNQITLPSGALLTLNANGTFDYDPNGQFESIPDFSSGSDSFTYDVSDGQGGTDTATVFITIFGQNDAPVGTDDAANVNDDATVTLNVLTNDNDIDGNSLTVQGIVPPITGATTLPNGDEQVTLPSGAIVTFTPSTGDMVYDPNGNFPGGGNDSFDYTLSDGRGGTDTATVNITINGTNQSPVAVDDPFSTDEETALNADVLANDSDPNGDPLTVTQVNGQAGNVGAQFQLASGSFLQMASTGQFTFTPGNQHQSLGVGQQAQESFTYTIEDGQGGSDQATVTVTINGVNDAPVALSDNNTTDEDTTASGNVLLNDSDLDGDTLTVTEVGGSTLAVGVATAGSAGGLFTINGDGSYSYDPTVALNSLRAGFSTNDFISYTVADGQGGSDVVNLVINVTGVNDAPTANDDPFNIAENAVLTGQNVLANDVDPDTGDIPTVVQVNSLPAAVGSQITLASGALLTVNGSGTFIYDPNGQFNSLQNGETAQDTFTYTLQDGSGVQDQATATITIDGVSSVPVALDDTGTTDEDSSTTLTVLANDSDLDGDTLSVAELDGTVVIAGDTVALASGALVTLNNDGTVSYDPNGQFEDLAAGGPDGSDSFTYTISDGNGGTDTATVDVTITGVNDAPVAVDDARNVTEDISFNIDLLANNGFGVDSDVDGGTLDITQINGANVTQGVAFSLPSGATLTKQADGSFQYDQLGNFNSLAVGAIALETFTYTLVDGQGGTDTASVTLTVNGVNDTPTAQDDSLAIGVDVLLNGDVLAANGGLPDSDPDIGDSLSIIGVQGGILLGTPVATDQGGLVTLQSDGTFAYDQNGQFSGLGSGASATDTFTYEISDGNGGTDTATVTITIGGSNLAPIANDDPVTTDEATSTLVLPLLNDTDGNGDTLFISAFDTAGTTGSVTDNLDGTFTFDPNGQFESLGVGQQATDTFTYTVSDGNGGQDTATVTVTVDGLNDGPDATDDSGLGFSTDEDNSFITGSVLLNDTDIDNGDVLTVLSYDDTGTTGMVIDNLDGTFTYDPNGQFESLGVGQSATDTFTYTISDGNGGTDTATITINVDGVNDGPVATDDGGLGFTTDEDTAFLTSSVFGNDSDPESDTLSIFTFDAVGTLGGQIIHQGGGIFSYDPSGQFESLGVGDTPPTDTFTYTITDGNGGFDTATVNITINPVNDTPDAVDDLGLGFFTNEDSAITTGNVLSNDSDIDLGDQLAVLGYDDTGTLGLVTDNGDGTFGYDPNGQFEGLNAGETATDTFTYTISDGNGGQDTATVTVTVDGVNDAPVAADDGGSGFTTNEDTAFTTGNVLSNDSDAEGQTLTVTGLDTTGTMGLVSDNGDGTFSYDPNGAFEALDTGDTATDSFVYTISDGNGGTDTATVTITIDGLDEGKNTITGTTGRDNLVGTSGDDAIFGLGGLLDVLTGGAGADCFDFAAALNSGTRDMATITDYEVGIDSITGIAATDVAQTRSFGGNLYMQLNGGENDLVVVVGITDINDLTFA